MSDEALLAPLTAAVRRVGADLLARFRAQSALSARTVEEFRTAFEELDGPASEVLRRELARLRPGARWTRELDPELPASGEAWVVDAVDGAVQFLRGMPHWCVSATLVRDRVPVAAVLHAPTLGGTFTAAAGHGAHHNGAPIAPSGTVDPAMALVCTSHPLFAGRQPEAVAAAGRSLSALLPAVGAVRNLGPTCWQIAEVAAGRIDAFWQYGVDESNLLGGALIAREAGAVVTDTEGRAWTADSPGFLVAGPALHPRLSALLAPAGRGV
ncbi:inositol monophosphatase [Streptomyces albus subsp. albus]|nr:inositol monophosphatase [Streptomyces albus subsp. albus]